MLDPGSCIRQLQFSIMSKFTAIVLIACILVCSSKDNKSKVKTKHHVEISGSVPKPKDEVGSERTIEISMEDVAKSSFKVKKLKSGAGEKYSAPEGSSFSCGKNGGTSLACFSKDNPDTEDPDQVCVANIKNKKGQKESCFTRNKKALCFDYPPDNAVIDEELVPQMPEAVETSHQNRKRRRRRSLQPDFSDTGFIKVLYFLDGRFMNTFLLFSDGNVTQAREDARFYLMLITNEITHIYQSLTNRSTLTVSQQSVNLDLAVYMADVKFPPNNDTAFLDPAWVEPVDGVLQNDINKFRAYMTSFSTETVYDHAAAITGYELSGSTIGRSYIGTTCHRYWSQYGYHTSITEFTGSEDRLLAHEFGHGIGMRHDPNTAPCPIDTYVMTPYLMSPDESDTYDVFSNCSVDKAVYSLNKLYTDGWYSNNCLYNHGVTSEMFLEQFCEGTYQSLTFDDQCKRQVNWDSLSCDEFQGYVNATHVSDCANGGIKCLSVAGVCDKFVVEVGDGTPCIATNATTPHVCFEAECQPVAEWCTTTT